MELYSWMLRNLRPLGLKYTILISWNFTPLWSIGSKCGIVISLKGTQLWWECAIVISWQRTQWWSVEHWQLRNCDELEENAQLWSVGRGGRNGDQSGDGHCIPTFINLCGLDADKGGQDDCDGDGDGDGDGELRITISREQKELPESVQLTGFFRAIQLPAGVTRPECPKGGKD